MLTFSGLARFLACPGAPLITPEVHPKSDYQRAADIGTKIHTWKETGEIPEGFDEKWFSGLDRAVLWPYGRHEVVASYDVRTRTAAILPTRQPHRAYPKDSSPFVIWGTIDLLAPPGIDGAVWVDDLKTGLPCDPSDPQLLIAAVVATKVYACDKAITSCTRIDRKLRKGKATRASAVFYLEELNAFEDTVQDAFGKWYMESLRPKATTNRHLHTNEGCRFCPARNNCNMYGGL